MNKHSAPIALVALFACASAHADVTIQEQTNLNVAVIKAHSSSTKRITDDKERTESQFRCDGFMSMLCGKNDSLEIVRLDRTLTMTADTKKKTYIEKPFPTPEQRAEMEQRIKAVAEKMKSCPMPPAAQSSPTVDTSKCTMTPATTNVATPGDTATFAGHATHHAIVTMTQSCANPDTGESCDMAYSLDSWLANDDVPELATRTTFTKNYMHAMGLDDAATLATSAQLSQFLTPYKDAMKKLASDSAALKGYPLKTTFRFAIGGPKCKSAAGSSSTAGGGGGGSSGNVLSDASGAAVGAAANTTAGAGESKATEAASNAAGGGVGGAIASSAAGAFASKMIGGLFSKKKAADTPPPASTSGSSTPAAAAPAPGMVTVAEISVETTSISSSAIPADQFEMPSDYKKMAPPPEKAWTEPSCPTVDSKG